MPGKSTINAEFAFRLLLRKHRGSGEPPCFFVGLEKVSDRETNAERGTLEKYVSVVQDIQEYKLRCLHMTLCMCKECIRQAAENLRVNEKAKSRSVTLQDVEKNTKDEIHECSEKEYEVS